MKVSVVSTNDFSGGAARGAYRLHKGLLSTGVDSTMFVRQKDTDDKSVIRIPGKLEWFTSPITRRLDILPIKFYRNHQRSTWSIGWLRNGTRSHLIGSDSDLIHLQWIGQGFVPIKAIGRLHRPIVWTIQDTWAFTGGCHYPEDCTRYRNACGACPQLSSKREWDLSRRVWKTKRNHWKHVDLTIVALSRWLADCARASSLFAEKRVEVIPLGIDTTVFRPMNKAFAREALNLPQKKKIVLAGAINVTGDPRKGFDLVRGALKRLASRRSMEETELLVFGGSQFDEFPDLGFGVKNLGYVHDDVTLALCYSAADVFVAPSRQEAFGQTVLEASACGTPCVTFDLTGPCDIVDHRVSGYLARTFEVEDLAAGISWVLEDPDRQRALSAAARKKVENWFTIEKIAHRYLELYEEVLDGHRRSSNQKG